MSSSHWRWLSKCVSLAYNIFRHTCWWRWARLTSFKAENMLYLSSCFSFKTLPKRLFIFQFEEMDLRYYFLRPLVWLGSRTQWETSSKIFESKKNLQSTTTRDSRWQMSFWVLRETTKWNTSMTSCAYFWAQLQPWGNPQRLRICWWGMLHKESEHWGATRRTPKVEEWLLGGTKLKSEWKGDCLDTKYQHRVG